MLGMVVGSYAGSMIAESFGAGSFSFTSIFASAIGGLFGIWLAYRFIS